MSIGQIAEIATMAVLGLVLKRFGWRMTMIMGILGHVIRFGIYSIGTKDLLWLVILSNVVHGFAYAFFFATVYIYVDENFPKDVRTSAQSMFNLLILGLGPLASNLLSRVGCSSTSRQGMKSIIIEYSSYPRPWGWWRRYSWLCSFIPRPRTRSPKRFPFLSHKSSAWLVLVAGLATWVAASTAAAQGPMPDDELARHLTTIRSQLENVTIDVARREELALEMAATLDRAAQSSPDSNVRRRRWSEAIELLDWFLKENPDRAAGASGAVSGGRLAVGAGKKLGGDQPRRARRIKNRERRPWPRSTTRSSDFVRSPGVATTPTLADNLRFRLAEALADRADLEPVVSEGRRTREAEALQLLDQAPTETGLGGFWHLLKADLLRRLKKPAEAELEIAEAVKAKPAPPGAEIVEVNIPILIERERFDDAVKSLDASMLDKPVKALWMVRVRLAQLAALPARARAFQGRV